MSDEIIYPVGWQNPVPQSIAMWQARQVLIEEELLDKVLEALAAIEDPIQRRKAEDKMEYSSNMLRNDPLLKMLVPVLGLREVDIDDMFIRAAKLQ